MKAGKSAARFGRRVTMYLRDYRFSSILLKYFLLLFVCLVLPVVGMNVWYGRQMRENMNQEILKRNEASLMQASSNVNSVILSMKNLAYSLSANANVKYLASISSASGDATENWNSLSEMLSVLGTANDYIDSIYVYFANSGSVISQSGLSGYEEFKDKEALNNFSSDMPPRIVMSARIKNNQYPHLLTLQYPIKITRNSSDVGLVVVNIDVEKLGNYIGSGRYRNKDYSPRLFIFDESMETLIYSDEYRLLQETEELEELRQLRGWKGTKSDIRMFGNQSYVVSHMQSEEDGFRYIYMSTVQDFEELNRESGSQLSAITVFIGIICLILACFLAVWVYRPIQRTIRLLSDMSMLTQWDPGEHVDEIEAIRRSILSAKRERDDLNEEIQERIVSLHNAQICALQTQINPHFLFNTLEAIGNAAALLMNGENQVTRAIYTLGKMMRISLSNENYLVPLREELDHVRQYVELVEFRFHGRVSLHQDIPETMGEERIVKLTLQPLIENAIQHGLAHMRSGGQIWLRGEKFGQENYVYIIDNGTGISSEKMEELSKQLCQSAVSGNAHIGLRNVDQRLKLVFGEEYGLSLSQSEEGGVCITVHFKTI